MISTQHPLPTQYLIQTQKSWLGNYSSIRLLSHIIIVTDSALVVSHFWAGVQSVNWSWQRFDGGLGAGWKSPNQEEEEANKASNYSVSPLTVPNHCCPADNKEAQLIRSAPSATIPVQLVNAPIINVVSTNMLVRQSIITAPLKLVFNLFRCNQICVGFYCRVPPNFVSMIYYQPELQTGLGVCTAALCKLQHLFYARPVPKHHCLITSCLPSYNMFVLCNLFRRCASISRLYPCESVSQSVIPIFRCSWDLVNFSSCGLVILSSFHIFILSSCQLFILPTSQVVHHGASKLVWPWSKCTYLQ